MPHSTPQSSCHRAQHIPCARVDSISTFSLQILLKPEWAPGLEEDLWQQSQQPAPQGCFSGSGRDLSLRCNAFLADADAMVLDPRFENLCSW